MSFIQPMMAASMPKVVPVLDPGKWAIEQKLDGHRLVVQVARSPMTDHHVTAWSRYGKERVLPEHLRAAFTLMPYGIYDGELHVPGGRSYGVTELTNAAELVYTAFDVLELMGVSTVNATYDERRAYLAAMLEAGVVGPLVCPLRIGWSRRVNSMAEVTAALVKVWDADGEGLILKRRASRYSVGKRPKGDWIKMKALRTAVLTVIGFEPSKGLIQDRGEYATIVLRDENGGTTTVKTLNDAECRRLEADAVNDDPQQHPRIGQLLRIEFHERTPDGNYRHPRMDRWEDE